jgi:hypothetical protein
MDSRFGAADHGCAKLQAIIVAGMMRSSWVFMYQRTGCRQRMEAQAREVRQFIPRQRMGNQLQMLEDCPR